MNSSSTAKGNDPEKWQKLLDVLDEKLQLGLLDYLRRVKSYHFEEDTLYIQTDDPADAEYLEREPIAQHLLLLAQDAIGIEKVKIDKLA